MAPDKYLLNLSTNLGFLTLTGGFWVLSSPNLSIPLFAVVGVHPRCSLGYVEWKLAQSFV